MATRAVQTPKAQSPVGRVVARMLAGMALGPTLFGGGLIRLAGVLFLGIGVGAVGSWLIQRSRPLRCAGCGVENYRGTVRPPAQRRPGTGRGRVIPAVVAAGRPRVPARLGRR